MKFGYRKPSLKKSFSASTKAIATRAIKKTIIPDYGKRGGIYTNPKKAVYNSLYSVTTVGVKDIIKKGPNRTKGKYSIYDHSPEYISNNKENKKESLNNYNKNNRIYYILAILSPIIGMLAYFVGLWMFFCVLIFGILEVICCAFIVKMEDNTNIIHPLSSIILNTIFFTFLILLNLYPIVFSLIHSPIGNEILYEGGVVSEFLSLLLVYMNIFIIKCLFQVYTKKKLLRKKNIYILNNIDRMLLDLEKSKNDKQSHNLDYQIGLFDFKLLDNIEAVDSLKIINTRIANIKINKLIDTCLYTINILMLNLKYKYLWKRFLYLYFSKQKKVIKNKIQNLYTLQRRLIDTKKEIKLNISFPIFQRFDQLKSTGISLQNNSYFIFQNDNIYPIRNDITLWATSLEKFKISKNTDAYESFGLNDNLLFFNENVSVIFDLSAILIIVPNGFYLFKYNELKFEYNEFYIVCNEKLDTCNCCEIKGYYWQHTTMNGTQDLRYKYNPKYPIVKHGICKLIFNNNSEIYIISSDLSNIKLFTSILCDK